MLALALALALVAPASAVAPLRATEDGTACSHGTKYEPADGRIIHIIGQDTDSIDEYVDATGVIPAGLMSYTALIFANGLDVPWVWGGETQHVSYLLEHYPQSAIQLGIALQDSLEATNLGLLDANILVLADYVKRAGVPFFIRPGFEFDRPGLGYDRQAYVNAFRRIVDKFREHGVTNVAWVWHGHGYSPDPVHLAAWYPGDDYVDWAAISFFEHPFQDPALPGAHAMADFAEAHGKPLMIAESTPKGRGANEQSWHDWYVPMLDFVTERNVKAVSYINTDWESRPRWAGWGDSRVQSDPFVFEQWMAEIGQPRYLKASESLFCET